MNATASEIEGEAAQEVDCAFLCHEFVVLEWCEKCVAPVPRFQFHMAALSCTAALHFCCVHAALSYQSRESTPACKHQRILFCKIVVTSSQKKESETKIWRRVTRIMGGIELVLASAGYTIINCLHQ